MFFFLSIFNQYFFNETLKIQMEDGKTYIFIFINNILLYIYITYLFENSNGINVIFKINLFDFYIGKIKASLISDEKNFVHYF